MQAKPKLLAVDDSPTNIAVMQEILADTYTLKTAFSGEEALEIAPEFLPDIVLLDIMMPGIDGYDVCREMRANSALSHTKIIMVSAKALISERLEGYAAGADDYITKPFEEEEILAKLRVYVRLRTMEDVERLKSGVMSMLGHEMSTQINGILLPATILMSDQEMETIERKMLAEMVYRNVKRLHGLLEEIVGSKEFDGIRADIAQLKPSIPRVGTN